MFKQEIANCLLAAGVPLALFDPDDCTADVYAGGRWVFVAHGVSARIFNEFVSKIPAEGIADDSLSVFATKRIDAATTLVAFVTTSDAGDRVDRVLLGDVRLFVEAIDPRYADLVANFIRSVPTLDPICWN